MGDFRTGIKNVLDTCILCISGGSHIFFIAHDHLIDRILDLIFWKGLMTPNLLQSIRFVMLVFRCKFGVIKCPRLLVITKTDLSLESCETPRLGGAWLPSWMSCNVQIIIIFLEFLRTCMASGLVFFMLCPPLALLYISHTSQLSWHGHSRRSVEK